MKSNAGDPKQSQRAASVKRGKLLIASEKLLIQPEERLMFYFRGQASGNGGGTEL